MKATGRFVFTLLSFTVLASAEEPTVNDTLKTQLVQGNNKFALELYGRLKTQKGNLFLSPYSISSALAMTYAGAHGNTEKQMAQVLHFDLGHERLHPVFHALNGELEARALQPGLELNIANALWGWKNWDLPEFINLTKTYYGAGFHEVEFGRATEATRRLINNWIEQQTKGRIKDLIEPGMLDPDWTRLVLTDAIYFKAHWAKPFAAGRTKVSPFHITKDKTVNVPMMHKNGKFKLMHIFFNRSFAFQAIELPYIGDELSMVIFLPVNVDGLGELEDALTADNLKKWLDSLNTESECIVYLPKFKITSKFRLEKVLAAMGMADAFSDLADFTGMKRMVDSLRPWISFVIHKAFVDVTEAGTEAAAATAVGIAESTSVFFIADHPFLFLIRDVRSNSILFLGRVTNPLE
jgi:serpin B